MWSTIRTPRYIGHDLDETSALYVDLHWALECLHMRYPDYMAQTTIHERQLYQLYLALKAAKEQQSQEHAEQSMEAERSARDAVPPQWRA